MITTICVVSDLHINSTVALCTPSINLDDGGTYRASKTQRWLWDCWTDLWEQMLERSKGERILIINGDLGDLDSKRRSHQMITRNNATIQSIVLDTIEPALEWADKIYIIRGTPAHIGKSAWLEEAIAQDLDTTVHNKANASWWHLRSVCEGVKFDIAHHTGMGNLPHTEKNAANKLSAITAYRYAVDMKQSPPDVVIRSHNHRYADSGGNYDTFSVCTAAWTSATEFVYRIGQENTIADIGAHVFVCNDGHYNYQKILYPPPELKRVWKLKM